MKETRKPRKRGGAWLLAAGLLATTAGIARAQVTFEEKPVPQEANFGPEYSPDARLDIYGFAMLDTGYEFNAADPNWFDVARPTKLPSFEDQFGKNGNWFAGVRQSRLGFKGFLPTSAGLVKTIFEFELFGTGVDAGQTTFRLRHAWGELGQFGAGQTWSPYMDPDVWPNSIEYWGPNGMVFFRNVQARWTPYQDGGSNVQIALERPGASGDAGTYADRVELQNVKPRFPLPDLSAHWRFADKWGHVQLAAIVRDIKWDDLVKDNVEINGHVTGWGVNLSSNINIAKDILHLQLKYGQGDENYMNDAPADVGAEHTGNPNKPLRGKALGDLGLLAFYDLNWSAEWTSTIGYSFLKIDNSNAQNPSDFKKGQYALANILYHPAPNVLMGPEVQWIKRDNFSDGFSSHDFKVQFSAKYSFDFSIGKKS
ncbi:MAG TPA: DcaP family trimeric outer membrane transporter [Thermoanaerobaculia bacterium]|nr:DcaP family trimeric outer membrane transporter [Thermoanaerobaculia bacterium]